MRLAVSTFREVALSASAPRSSKDWVRPEVRCCTCKGSYRGRRACLSFADFHGPNLYIYIYINCIIHALVIIYHWSSTFFHPLSPSSAPLAGQADDGCRQAGEGQDQVVQPRGWNTSNITELFTVLRYFIKRWLKAILIFKKKDKLRGGLLNKL